MNSGVKKVIKGLGVVVALAIAAGGTFALVSTSRFDSSLATVYDVPVPDVVASKNDDVIARGKHLVASVGACASTGCHGADLGGGRPIAMGPVGTLAAPNITSEGLGAAYSDGEIARLIRHGLKKDGRTVRFMPVQDINWLPQEDVVAIISYLRTVPPVDRPNQTMIVGTLGKILDRQDKFVFDVARKIDHAHIETAPPPAPTAEYGAFVARLCTGCHGEHLSGGPLPGAPPSVPTPLNLTPDESGLKAWSFEDFDKLMKTGVRKSGAQLNPFMPIESWRNLDDTEMHALWAYLRTVTPMTFGGR
jgi:hypothetical protein